MPVHIVALAGDLIRLSRLAPGADVLMEFTGVREGERCTEPAYESEALEPTSNPRIQRRGDTGVEGLALNGPLGPSSAVHTFDALSCWSSAKCRLANERRPTNQLTISRTARGLGLRLYKGAWRRLPATNSTNATSSQNPRRHADPRGKSLSACRSSGAVPSDLI